MKRLLLLFVIAAGITSSCFCAMTANFKQYNKRYNYEYFPGSGAYLAVTGPNHYREAVAAGTGANRLYVEGNYLYLIFPKERHVYDIGSNPKKPSRSRIEKF